MPRTRQQIIDTLFAQAETDPILSSVSRSLVGKELTYFAGNVIYQVESMGNAVSRFSDVSRADFQQLIAYAYTNDVPCDTVKPATVRITIKTSKVQVFAPFAIRLEVGNLSFYNIDFVRSDQQITLYQGTPKAVTSVSRSTEGATLDALGIDSGVLTDSSYQSWMLYKEFQKGTYQSSYIKLGVNAVSDSVRVFARQMGTNPTAGILVDESQIVFPYTEFNQSLVSPEAKLYKVRTGWDLSVNVLFGDDNWAMQVNQDQFQYEVYWLEAGVTNFNLKATNKLYLGYDNDPSQKTLLRDSGGSEYYSVTSYSLGESQSIAYARSYVQTKKFAQQGLVTEQQILAYLGSLPSVNSSRVDTDSESNTITVTLKPSDPDDTYFQFIEDYLYQYGVVGNKYSVVVATPLDFYVQLSAISQSGLSEMSRARQAIEEYCAYDALSINTPISSAILNQKLQQAGINNVSATIVVEGEPVSPGVDQSQKLQAQPAINTIRQYSGSGELVGFDSDGTYRQIQSGTLVVPESPVLSVVGDFFFLSGISAGSIVSYLLNKQDARSLCVDARNILTDSVGNPIYGKFFEYNEDAIQFLQMDGGVYRVLNYSNSPIFQEGDTSIFNRISTIRPYGESFPLSLYDLTGASIKLAESGTFAIVNSLLYCAVNVSTTSTPQYRIAQFQLQTKDGVTSWTLQRFVGTATSSDVRMTRFLVYEGNILVPTTFDPSTGVWTGYDVFNTLTTRTYVGTVSLQGTTTFAPQYMRFSDGYLYALQDGDTPALVQCSFRFSSNLQLLQLNLQSKLDFSDSVPTVLNAIDSDGVIFMSNEDSIWKSTIQSEGAAVLIADSQQFMSTGSVDYESGIIYGIDIVGSDNYLNYSVAGTLQGSSVYPRYVNNE